MEGASVQLVAEQLPETLLLRIDREVAGDCAVQLVIPEERVEMYIARRKGLRKPADTPAHLLLSIGGLAVEGKLAHALGLQNLQVERQLARLAAADCHEK